MSHLKDDMEGALRNELREACSHEVNRMLFELYGPAELNSMSEAKLMDCIKKVAVNGVFREVHWQTFFRISQNEGESASKYVARLKAQASLCEFQITCSKTGCAHNNNFSDLMVAHQMISGLADPECQSKLLAEAESLNTFEKKFTRLLSMESVLQCTPQLNAPPGTPSRVAAQKSAYKKGKFPPRKSTQQEPTRKNWQCFGCGQTSHPGKSNSREDCPAYGKTCKSCNILNHFESVCRRARRRNGIGTSKSATAHDAESNSDERQPDTSLRSLGAASPDLQDFRLGPDKGGFI